MKNIMMGWVIGLSLLGSCYGGRAEEEAAAVLVALSRRPVQHSVPQGPTVDPKVGRRVSPRLHPELQPQPEPELQPKPQLQKAKRHGRGHSDSASARRVSLRTRRIPPEPTLLASKRVKKGSRINADLYLLLGSEVEAREAARKKEGFAAHSAGKKETITSFRKWLSDNPNNPECRKIKAALESLKNANPAQIKKVGVDLLGKGTTLQRPGTPNNRHTRFNMKRKLMALVAEKYQPHLV